ncbi:hypothetical protein DYB26_002640 [Aphanomyces astaci]|uniref:Uncharacterized protein n=2 Tax=Aphanomyces astaci TaxID=112090 RepID=A0A3R7B5C0_APHAT|nr:hypothetical protein DYB26_002640 [Aphanomyces astaci]
MPVSACMDVFTKKRVAMWDMANCDYRGVTETEWATWLSHAFEEEPQDRDVLTKRLTTAIRFDTTILDANSRIDKMLDNLMRALERDDQAWVLDQEGTTVVDIMVKAIKPLGLPTQAGPPTSKRMEDKSSRQFAMANAMEKNCLKQEESRAILLRQQEELVRQQNELKQAIAEQARFSETLQEMLRQASDAMRQ